MHAIPNLLCIAGAYQAATGLDQSTVSWRALGDVRKLSALAEGKDIQVTRYERAMIWFSENWPEGVEWPDAVNRPLSAEGADA